MRITDIAAEPFYAISYRTSGRGGKPQNMILPFYRATVDSLPESISSFVITSDLQGREHDRRANRLLGEAVADELKILEESAQIPAVSFVALPGDFFDYPLLHSRGGTGDVTSVWNAFASKFPFVVGVHGNHDIVTESELAENAYILDGTSATIGGLRIGGVSGIVGSKLRNQRKTEDEFFCALIDATDASNDLVLLHQGPEDPINGQRGDPMITEFFESHGDFIVAIGHCHWTTPFVEIGTNQILNVDARLFVISTADN